MIAGTGVLLGAIWPKRRWVLFGVTLGLAALLTTITARELARPLGVPGLFQIGALLGAVMIEVALIAALGQRYRDPEDRTFNLAVMLVVGLHFLPMAFAFGPVVAALAVACVINAVLGLRVFRAVNLPVFWAIDGALKVLAGAIAYFIAPG
jgi:hypothetical protein